MPSYLGEIWMNLTKNRTTHRPASPRISASPSLTTFPGDRYFRPDAKNIYISILREMLIERGAKPYYPESLPARWSIPDLQACAAFQRAQGWSRDRTSGIPDATTWEYLVNGQGNDIVGEEVTTADEEELERPIIRHPSLGNLLPLEPPEFPGTDQFGPDLTNFWILVLRLRLISQGWTPELCPTLESDDDMRSACTWDESLRTACLRFQVDNGFRGAQADGHPSEAMWKLLWKR